MWHMNWPSPGNDPWYAANPTESLARRTYYGVNGIPYHFIDGAVASGQSGVTNQYNTRHATASPVWLEVRASMNGRGDSVLLRVRAVANTAINGNYRLRMVLVEVHETWTTPSPNGQTSFPYPFVEFGLPGGSTGWAFAHSGSTSDTIVVTGSFPLRTSGYEPFTLDNTGLVAFVQNDATHEVLQSAYTRLPLDFPSINVSTFTATDFGGNQDGRIDPGEQGQIAVTLNNGVYFETATGVTARLQSTVTGITVLDSIRPFGTILPGATANNNANPFLIQVAANVPVQWANFNVLISADSGYSSQGTIQVRIGRPDLLVVQADSAFDFLMYYTTTLDTLGIAYDKWDMDQALLQPTEFLRYRQAIWFTGMRGAPDVLSEWDRGLIAGFITAGKSILISSQNGLERAWQADTNFVNNILRAHVVLEDISNYQMLGVAGDPFFGGLTLRTAGAGGAGDCDNPTVMVPINNAVGMFRYNGRTDFGGVYYEIPTVPPLDSPRVVFLGFPFEAVSGSQQTSTRVQVLRAIFDFFNHVSSTPEVGTSSLPSRFRLSEAFPNPFNPTVTVSLALPRTSAVTATVFDYAGREVQHVAAGTLAPGTHALTLNLAGQPSGLYFLRVSAGTESAVCKLALMK